MTIDADLKSWATWVIKQKDGSMGWKNRSPLTNFGTVVGKGYGSNTELWIPENKDMELFDSQVRMLPVGGVRLLRLYYVQFGCKLRKTAEAMGKHPQSMKREILKTQALLQKIIDSELERVTESARI